MNRNKWIFIFLSLFLTHWLFAEKIEFRDGKTIENSDTIIFDGEKFYSGNNVYERKDLLEIFISKPKNEDKKINLHIDSDVIELIEKATKYSEIYSDYPGIILLDRGEWKLSAGGTRKYQYHFQGIILKESAKSFGDVGLSFDETQEKVDIKLARTIHFDGTIFNLNPDKIKTVLPQNKLDYFGREKNRTFSLEEIKIPCIVEYIYEYDEFNPFDTNIFSASWNFQSSYPVILSDVKVNIPKETLLNISFENYDKFEYETNIISGKDETIYYWALKNILPYITEPYMPPINDVIPKLSFTNQMDWDYIFNWYKKMQIKRMVATDFVKEKVKNIIGDENDTESKIAKIYHWLQEKIIYISIKGSAGSGLSGHPAEETLKNNYGDCIDKSILFSTMLNILNINAYPVILKTNYYSLEPYTLPTLGGDHAITQIEFNGKTFFLDSTSSTHRYPSFRTDDQGAPYIVALKKEIGIIPVPPPEENEKKYIYKINITDKKNIDVDFYTTYNGSYEAGVRAFWKYKRKIDHPVLMRQWISSIHPDANLKNYEIENLEDISKPLSIKTNYDIQNYIKKAGNLYIFKIIDVQKSFSEIVLDEKSRKYALVYPAVEMRVNNIEINVPFNFKIESVPENKIVENDFVSFERKIKIIETKILYEDIFKIKKKIVPVEKYGEHKKLLQEIEKLTAQQIIFTD